MGTSASGGGPKSFVRRDHLRQVIDCLGFSVSVHLIDDII